MLDFAPAGREELMDRAALPKEPRELRARIRAGEWQTTTEGLAPGFVQANLAIVPKDLAFDFLLFCQRNAQPCPVLEVLEPGSPEPRETAPGADIRTDLPRYRIYENGSLVDEVTEITDRWQDDFVSFLLGCSFSFESAMLAAGIPLRHLQEGNDVPVYVTNRATAAAGAFSGPLVVSMRPIHHTQVVRAVQTTSRFPGVHGAPVHIGDPLEIGISDLDNPQWGARTEVRDGEVPVFWACGVTPQAVALASKPPLMITHAAGHMFLTDLQDAHLAVL